MSPNLGKLDVGLLKGFSFWSLSHQRWNVTLEPRRPVTFYA